MIDRPVDVAGGKDAGLDLAVDEFEDSEPEAGEGSLTLEDCLDLSEYQATLPHIP